ncbi:hypothetical protein BDV25DRAFT_139617 [Aspergillus avenaceus]|uniref:Uncharacterized protein n=1 Tax=Aspergillus avenaceus TaxID=36643 RepID=A0A5N6TW63_ASPAV|nr:hypothetical protein BDV25DRAFT_139617 [Aspergillus avenaceus]
MAFRKYGFLGLIAFAAQLAALEYRLSDTIYPSIEAAPESLLGSIDDFPETHEVIGFKMVTRDQMQDYVNFGLSFEIINGRQDPALPFDNSALGYGLVLESSTDALDGTNPEVMACAVAADIAMFQALDKVWIDPWYYDENGVLRNLWAHDDLWDHEQKEQRLRWYIRHNFGYPNPADILRITASDHSHIVLLPYALVNGHLKWIFQVACASVPEIKAKWMDNVDVQQWENIRWNIQQQ